MTILAKLKSVWRSWFGAFCRTPAPEFTSVREMQDAWAEIEKDIEATTPTKAATEILAAKATALAAEKGITPTKARCQILKTDAELRRRFVDEANH